MELDAPPKFQGPRGEFLKWSSTMLPHNHPIPTFFSWYHVDPLLKKEVFTLENQVIQKIP